ncbi:RtcB family protein [Candidatus Woesearchaeota archaeon]|nr:RtcB family protein [Candidatus Woesearchaeota archaeon]
MNQDKPQDIHPRKLNEYSYLVEKQGNMKVPLKIFASEKLLQKMLQDRCIQQGINVAALPGIKGWSIMMPDAHQGYGFSIGGVAAIDTKDGCISPGGIGFDINCGVRLLQTNLTKEQVYPKIKELLEVLFKHVPPGVGAKSIFRLSDGELDDVLRNGVQWALRNNYGLPEDAESCEEGGTMPGADPSKVSPTAKARGRGQLGTLGSGNHFLEVQYVDKIFNKEVAEVFGIKKEGQVVVLIHCGSRGLGHQTCTDYLKKMEAAYPEIIKSLPEKDLVYAPADSHISHDYYKAMCAAANFAWCNRHMIGHQTRRSFQEVFAKDVQLTTVYDVAHNIAKKEEHEAEGEQFLAWVHRKGATRAFGPHRPEIPLKYQETGQPIFIPGSMGTSSYVLVGTEKSMKESFGSTAHGAGRAMSRFAANQQWRGDQLKNQLEKEQNIHIKAASWRGISEEAPLAYKDVDEVVRVSDEAGIGKLVAQLRPMGVVKG